jgi:hypothetical protein
MSTDALSDRRPVAIDWRGLLQKLTLVDWAQRPSKHQLDRLEAAITEQEDLLGTVMALREGTADRHGSLWTEIATWLREARDRHEVMDLSGGWQRVYDARWATVHLLPEDMLAAHGANLRDQAADTLGGGKRRAAERLLTLPRGGAADVAQAQRIVDDHFKGVYMRAHHARTQLFYLPIALAAMLAGLLWVSAHVSAPDVAPWSTIGDTPLLVWVYVFGALGALLSATLGTIRGVTRENYLILTGSRVNITRPLLGAASAAAVVVILETNLFNLDGPPSDRPVLLAAALAAGFSERLLTSAINAVVRAEPKKEA